MPRADCRWLINSLLISLAKGSRNGAERVAAEVADRGFCSSKSSYYYGVELHMVALGRMYQLPLPALLRVRRASQHDLSALRELDPDLGTGCLFGDKACSDAETETVFAACDTHLVMLYKRKRNKPQTAAPAL